MHPKSAVDQQLEAAQQEGIESAYGDESINFKSHNMVTNTFESTPVSMSSPMRDAENIIMPLVSNSVNAATHTFTITSTLSYDTDTANSTPSIGEFAIATIIPRSSSLTSAPNEVSMSEQIHESERPQIITSGCEAFVKITAHISFLFMISF